MDFKNQTILLDFILTGLSADLTIQLYLFVFFFTVYVFSVLGNFGMITLIRIAPHLHTPMYFFLTHLSIVDLCYSSTITPKMLADFLSAKKLISLIACAIQMSLFSMFATSECCLVTAMAYDRYLAICQPLHYHLIMNKNLCWQLVISAYFSSFMASVAHTTAIFSLPLCGSSTINHFYCDIPPLLKLTCKHSTIRKSIVFSFALIMGVCSLSVILTSYVSIISTILRIQSAKGRHKAFSTCASHLTVVVLFYSTVFCIYFRPSLGLDLESMDKIFSLFYTVVSPLLNPLIYSLRNIEVKRALMKVLVSYVSNCHGKSNAPNMGHVVPHFITNK
ncbi:olfactory receptor 5G26-like [Discoglossus pictus]